eukprot:6570352-Pyramimonas_sp.AAC.2
MSANYSHHAERLSSSIRNKFSETVQLQPASEAVCRLQSVSRAPEKRERRSINAHSVFRATA